MSTQSAQLIIRTQEAVVKTLSLTMTVLRIGRAPENGLQLDHNMISRSHAEIRLQAQGVTLTDLGSSNGTFIGSERLLAHQPHLLTEGSSFRIGPYWFTYHTSVAEPQEADEPPMQEPATRLPEFTTTRLEMAVPKMVSSPQAEPPQRRFPAKGAISLFARFLPDIYQENDFLQRFLRIFEDIWEPLEYRQDHIALYFDPRTCPVSFLPWLASWLDIPLNHHWPEARQRRLLSQAMELYSWRGTSYGLARLIEICTGLTPEITQKPNEPFIFHIRITLSRTHNEEPVDRSFLEDLIQTHKPAHAGYILEVV
ncbi:MAG TPA: phage tail protein I [Ktedonobacteraceae bacterium]|nr:phage tail protein I [Ktedonobacteraceae bacterium]